MPLGARTDPLPGRACCALPCDCRKPAGRPVCGNGGASADRRPLIVRTIAAVQVQAWQSAHDALLRGSKGACPGTTQICASQPTSEDDPMTHDFRRPIAMALAALGSVLWVAPATAIQPLQGRTITGAAVASTDPTAVMEYDPNLDITWLRDWNMNGSMDWNAANRWVAQLTVGTFADWSLPTALNQDGSGPCGPGYNCDSSQMGYLYYSELGNFAYQTPGWGTQNYGPFQNIYGDDYWTSTVYGPDPYFVWVFGTTGGVQSPIGWSTSLPAVAVRRGDVATAVPEPQQWALMLLGLSVAAATWMRRPH